MAFNLKEAMINHVDSGDLILDILEAQEEFGDDKHGLGVRVANILNDFSSKVQDEMVSRQSHINDAYIEASRRGECYGPSPLAKLMARDARGDYDLKQRKES